jgi:hypothetical protein
VDLVESIAGESEANRSERVVAQGLEDDAVNCRRQGGQGCTDY